MDTITFSQVFAIISLLALIVVSVLNRNMVPVEKISELLEKAGSIADRTPSNIDDIAVDIAEQLFDTALRLGLIQSDESAQSIVKQATERTQELEKQAK